VGSVKRCKNPKCGQTFTPDWKDKNVLYCPDCRNNRFKDRQAEQKYDRVHEKRKLGNPKQNREILKFLKKKQKDEDKYYDSIYTK
jgi:predicted  nucleic acid-binding Zn-ribbon protein